MSRQESKDKQAVKGFVTGTLGCGCPEEVFEKLDVETGDGDLFTTRLVIGDRLLVHVLESDDPRRVRQILPELIEAGKLELGRQGLHRFRLVVASDLPDDCCWHQVEAAFPRLVAANEDFYLHLVDRKAAAFG